MTTPIMFPSDDAETSAAGEFRALHECVNEEIRRLGFSAAAPFPTNTHPKVVADYTLKFYIADQRGRKVAVLIISNKVNPHMVARSVQQAHEARNALGKRLNEVILEPLAHGHICGLSYAIWPLHFDLSSFRLVRFWQKRFLLPRVCAWLAAASRQTLCTSIAPDQIQSLYILPLTRLSADRRYSAGLRSAASIAADRVSAGQLRPVTVLQHSDLWLGNILLSSKRNEIAKNFRGFYVIDWSGATICGHPFFDLLIFCRSINVSTSSLRSVIEHYCLAIDCGLPDTVAYTLAGLGVLGMHLEHFPETHYLAMCEKVFAYALAAV